MSPSEKRSKTGGHGVEVGPFVGIGVFVDSSAACGDGTRVGSTVLVGSMTAVGVPEPQAVVAMDRKRIAMTSARAFFISTSEFSFHWRDTKLV